MRILYLPYTSSDETFTCFNCGIPNFSSGLFDTVCGDSFTSKVTNNNTGPSESSIWSSDIPESTGSSASCDISNLSSIPNSSLNDSSLLEEDGRQPLCSSPKTKNPQKLKSSNVKLASLNIQSVMSAKKKPSFWNFLDNVQADIVCGCETWLSSSVGDSEILPANSPYNIYRKNRPDGYGGSLLLIKSDIISEPVDIQTRCDIIFRKVQCSDSQTLIIGSAYRPTNNDMDYANELVEVIQRVCHKYMDAVVWLAGDFNLPDIDWSRNNITGHQYRKDVNKAFLTLESDLGLHQTIDSPTREDNILDLFLRNRPILYRSTVIPGISDHHAIINDSHITTTRQKPIKQTIFMWGKAIIQGIKDMCKELSNSIIQGFTSKSNMDDVWSLFKDGCQKIIEDNVPSRTTSQRFTQPWINRDVRHITHPRRHVRIARSCTKPNTQCASHKGQRQRSTEASKGHQAPQSDQT